MITEVDIARRFGIPYLIIVESTVNLPQSILKGAQVVVEIAGDEIFDLERIEKIVFPCIHVLKEE
jgi:hypothetical protein